MYSYERMCSSLPATRFANGCSSCADDSFGRGCLLTGRIHCGVEDWAVVPLVACPVCVCKITSDIDVVNVPCPYVQPRRPGHPHNTKRKVRYEAQTFSRLLPSCGCSPVCSLDYIAVPVHVSIPLV